MSTYRSNLWSLGCRKWSSDVWCVEVSPPAWLGLGLSLLFMHDSLPLFILFYPLICYLMILQPKFPNEYFFFLDFNPFWRFLLSFLLNFLNFYFSGLSSLFKGSDWRFYFSFVFISFILQVMKFSAYWPCQAQKFLQILPLKLRIFLIYLHYFISRFESQHDTA